MTHRTQIWTVSTDVFRNHPVVGIGSGAHPVAVANMLGRPLVAHNTYVSVLAELGIVGELIFLGLLAALFYSTFRLPRPERALWLLILATWCIGVGGGTWEYRKITWFLFSLLAAHVYARRPGRPAAAKPKIG